MGTDNATDNATTNQTPSKKAPKAEKDDVPLHMLSGTFGNPNSSKLMKTWKLDELFSDHSSCDKF